VSGDLLKRLKTIVNCQA